MTYRPKERKWDWRAHLTPEEAARVGGLETDIANYRKFMAEDAAELSPIRNRAIHRAKRADAKLPTAEDVRGILNVARRAKEQEA